MAWCTIRCVMVSICFESGNKWMRCVLVLSLDVWSFSFCVSMVSATDCILLAAPSLCVLTLTCSILPQKIFLTLTTLMQKRVPQISACATFRIIPFPVPNVRGGGKSSNAFPSKTFYVQKHNRFSDGCLSSFMGMAFRKGSFSDELPESRISTALG